MINTNFPCTIFIMNSIVVKTDLFRANLRELIADNGLVFKTEDELKQLDGEELEDAMKNNLGLTQMIDAITELHEIHVRAALIPAATKPVAKPKQVKVKEEKPAKKQPTEKPTKKKPAKTQPTEKPTEKPQPAETTPQIKKRGPTPYAMFTSTVTAANKALSKKESPIGWNDVTVTVSLDKVTEKLSQILAHDEAKQLKDMIGTEQTMETLLHICADVLTASTGKIQAMTLTSMLWSATGNVDPFQS
jgi:hypothetical protein